jgi:hypothetical protein
MLDHTKIASINFFENVNIFIDWEPCINLKQFPRIQFASTEIIDQVSLSEEVCSKQIKLY